MTSLNDELYQKLTSAGFIKAKKGSLIKKLFNGYLFEVRPENGSWEKDNWLCIYIYSGLFGELMTLAFNETEAVFNEYLPRKLRKDTSGCLGMSMVRWKKRVSDDRNALCSAEIYLTADELISIVNDLTTPEQIFYHFYSHGLLGQFIVLIENLWVYIFTCKECKFTNERMISQLDEAFMLKHTCQWNLYKELDVSVIERFSSIYESVKLKVA